MIQFIKPLFDRLINKIKIKWLDVLIIVLFIIDSILTVWAVNVYTTRVISKKETVPTSSFVINTKHWVEDRFFSNNNMVKIFPNIRVIDKNGQEIWVKDVI